MRQKLVVATFRRSPKWGGRGERKDQRKEKKKKQERKGGRIRSASSAKCGSIESHAGDVTVKRSQGITLVVYLFLP